MKRSKPRTAPEVTHTTHSQRGPKPVSQRAAASLSDRARRPDLPTRKWTQLLVLGFLGVGAFGLTFALVRWAEHPADAPAARPLAMVWVPGGEFTMGTDSELGWPDEKPAHRVRVDGFWMDETEVTNAQFRTFIQATGYVNVLHSWATDKDDEVPRPVTPCDSFFKWVKMCMRVIRVGWNRTIP